MTALIASFTAMIGPFIIENIYYTLVYMSVGGYTVTIILLLSDTSRRNFVI